MNAQLQVLTTIVEKGTDDRFFGRDGIALKQYSNQRDDLLTKDIEHIEDCKKNHDDSADLYKERIIRLEGYYKDS